MSATPNGKHQLTPAQQYLNDLWDEHIRDEFSDKDAISTIDTMVPDAYVNHIPVLTGGVGREQLKEFYSKHFIPKMPPDTEIVPISRTIGEERLVDEMIFRFTHTMEMDWMLPGVAPTGRQACQRAHLLGPGFGSGSTGIAGSGRTARGRSGNRGEIGGPDTTVEPTDSARSRGWGLSGPNRSKRICG